MSGKDWYENTVEGLAAWWANFFLRMGDFSIKYPVIDTNQPELEAIANWIAYWAGVRHSFDDSSKQLTKYWNTISGNDPTADPPMSFTFVLPLPKPPEVPTGIEKFIRDIRREVVNLGSYAKADGLALGFESTSAAKPAPESVKPTIQVFPAASGYHFSVVVSGRGEATMYDVYTSFKGSEWTKVGSLNGKSGDIYITPTTPGNAEQLQVRVQLRKNNTDYGQPSEPVYTTLNP